MTVGRPLWSSNEQPQSRNRKESRPTTKRFRDHIDAL
jgi:hypothetical protein